MNDQAVLNPRSADITAILKTPKPIQKYDAN
jgi:hypothetical protein